MGLNRVSTFLAQPRNAPSADEWDAARVIEFGIGPAKLELDKGHSGGVRQAAGGMHWLSLLCFLEGLNPVELVLIPELGQRVQHELMQLQEYDVLEAYAACLEALCSTGTHYKEAQDVAV